jgi:hypothetical protein
MEYARWSHKLMRTETRRSSSSCPPTRKAPRGARERDAPEARIPVTATLVGEEYQILERAMAAAEEELGKGARRGKCLEQVCEAYLQGDDTRPPVKTC